MLEILMNRTKSFAYDGKPHLPQVMLMKGLTYNERDIDRDILERALEVEVRETIKGENGVE